jgi:hypothetical protein
LDSPLDAVLLWKGGEGFICTNCGIDYIVIAVGYRVPFRLDEFTFCCELIIKRLQFPATGG